jgi:hypothetical protein
LRRKSLFFLAPVIALCVIMAISAAYSYSLNFNMNANVAETGSVSVTIDSTNYTSNQTLAIDWGNVTPGQQYTKAITITNDVNAPVTPNIVTSGLPSGWTLTLSDPGAIAANSAANRNIVLTTSSTATAGSSSWTATLTVS